MSVKKRIIHGLSAGFLGTLLNIVVQLTSVPVLLHYWGSQYYGEWLVLFALPSYIAMSDIGLGTIISTEINKLNSQNQIKAAADIFSQSFNLIIRVGVVVTAFSLAIVFIPSFKDSLKITSISQSQFFATIILLVAYSYLALILTLPMGLYIAIGKYAYGKHIENFFRLFEFLLFMGAVVMGSNMFVASICFCVARIGQALFIYFDLRKRTPIIGFTIKKFDISLIKRYIKPSLSMMILYLGQNFLVQGLIVVVNITLGAPFVIIFTTTRTLCNFSKQLVSVVNYSFFGEFTKSFIQGNLELTKRLLKRANQIALIITASAVVFLYFFGPYVISIWTHGKVKTDHAFLVLFLGTVLANSVWQVRWSFLLAINGHVRTVIPFVIACITSILLAYFFSGTYGLWIIAGALLVNDLIMMPVVFKISNFKLNAIAT